jgi:hypothetical protein
VSAIKKKGANKRMDKTRQDKQGQGQALPLLLYCTAPRFSAGSSCFTTTGGDNASIFRGDTLHLSAIYTDILLRVNI